MNKKNIFSPEKDFLKRHKASGFVPLQSIAYNINNGGEIHKKSFRCQRAFSEGPKHDVVMFNQDVNKLP